MNKIAKRKLNRLDYMRKWQKANLDKKRTYARRWARNNREKMNRWNKANPDKVKAIKNKWLKNNPDKRRAVVRRYYANNINVRIAFNLRGVLRHALFAQLTSKKDHFNDLIGIPIQGLREHLENQFKPGMSWKNYGKWHIDHIKPLSSFDLTKPEEQKKAMNWKNLQPLWAKENISKGAKISS